MCEAVGSTASTTYHSWVTCSLPVPSHFIRTLALLLNTTHIWIFIKAQRISVKRLASLGRDEDGCWGASPGTAQVKGLWLQYSWYRVLLSAGPRFLCRRPHLMVLNSISCSLVLAQAS